MDFFSWLSDTQEGVRYLSALVIGCIGLFFYGANLYIFLCSIFPKPEDEKRFVSMVPPLGGLLIALAFLLFIPAPWKWLALIGASDPAFFVFIYSICYSGPGKEKDNNKKNGK